MPPAALGLSQGAARANQERYAGSVQYKVHVTTPSGNGYTPEAAPPKEGANGEAWIEVVWIGSMHADANLVLQVAKSSAYTPSSEDVGSVLKYEVVGYDGGSFTESGKAFTVQTARVRPLPEPPRRVLIPLMPTKPAGGTFTVLTYNVLADLYATVRWLLPNVGAVDNACHSKSSLRTRNRGCCRGSTDAPTCCGSCFRTTQTCCACRKCRCVVVCLCHKPRFSHQSNHFAEFWEPQLAKHGYGAAYKKKTTEIYTAANAFAMDGCATFFRTARFALVKKYEVEFNKAAKSLSDTIAPDHRDAALSRMLKV